MSNSIIVPLHDFSEQYKSGAFSDCRVSCEDRVWNLHRLVLSTRSTFFKAALGGNFQVLFSAQFDLSVWDPSYLVDARLAKELLQESNTDEVTLEEQDPEIVDQALRYIYSCSMSHIDELITDDPDGMKLVAYKTYVPLYVLGDFLGLHALCRDITDRLHRTNRRMAAHIQRLAAEDPDGRLALEPDFQADFADCARLAYSIPVRRTQNDIDGAIPGGIRTPFLELFEFTRYRPLDDALGAIASAAPQLLVDVMLTMRDFEGIGHPSRRPLACKDCGVHPLTGNPSPEQSTPRGQVAANPEIEVKDQGAGTNFWMSYNLCFECGVYYSRRDLLCTEYRPRLKHAKEDSKATQ